ncbi:MAG: beta-L-arabinofuranosidase domain-containing protein, partial [Luteolibacter sp.]
MKKPDSILFFATIFVAVCCSVQAAPPVPAAEPFPLSQVRLLDGPFKQRQEVDARYLLSVVDPDRLLSGFRAQAGLPEKAKRYGGWEARGINGHSLGHYLSAVSALYAATGDPKALARVNYVVAELAACQKANGDGYVLPVNKRVYEELRRGRIKASGFSLNDEWVPNYTLHKVLAGLHDAWNLAANKQALDVETQLADYLAGVYQKLTPTQAQETLKSEFGGMNEVFADLTAATGDPRYLELARTVFHHDAILGPLELGQDKLNGQHGNTQIPKIVGLARGYELTGQAGYRTAVQTFWDSVVNERSFCIGGHGEDEHFFPLEKFAENLKPHTAETCNSYNMIKLTGHLFAWDPKAAEMDFVERALLNHVMANIGRQPGEFGYFLGLESVGTKVFSTSEGAWWCCVGTGMENPARYGEQVYFHGSSALWVNLFMASELDWKEMGVKLRQETKFPDSDAMRFSLGAVKPVKFALKIRHPYWCALPVVKVNGQAIPVTSQPSSYLTIDREWKSGDIIELQLPMKLRTEALPHSNGKTIALLYGPNVLAGIVPTTSGAADPAKRRWDDHLKAPGKTGETPPVFVATDEADLLAHLKPTGKAFAEFRSDGVVKRQDLIFVPFNRIYEEHYAVYFPLLNPSEWKAGEGDLLAAEARRTKLDQATLDTVQPGFQQSEVEHRFQSENSESGDFQDRKWRDARGGGWFSYEVAVDPSKPVALVCTYFGGDVGRDFDILVDGKKVASQKIEGSPRGKFFNAVYALPPAETKG